VERFGGGKMGAPRGYVGGEISVHADVGTAMVADGGGGAHGRVE
jgi:hypothetical protein